MSGATHLTQKLIDDLKSSSRLLLYTAKGILKQLGLPIWDWPMCMTILLVLIGTIANW